MISLFSNSSILFENFHPEEGLGSYLRWSSGNSKLILINRSNAPQKSIISFTILRPDNTELELFTKYKSQTNTKKILKALDFNMNLILDPGLNVIVLKFQMGTLEILFLAFQITKSRF